MRSSAFVASIVLWISTSGCAALTGLSNLDECPEGACGDATIDSHAGDQGIDVTDGGGEANDSATTETTDSGDAGDATRDTGDAADAVDSFDAHDAADATDSGVDTFDSAPPVDTGPCTLTCDTTHSLGSSCVGGKCVYTSCKAGFADCITSGTDVDGCETPTTTTTDCGGCGNICDTSTATTETCAGGRCIYTCKTGFADCVTTAPDTDGCETPTNTITNCAACGNKCDTLHSNGASCDGTTCKYTSCKPGFADCNSGAPNIDGCETSTSTTTDCGGCGKACDIVHSTPTSCTSGTCNYTCMSGFVDCNKATGDLGGCECAGTACCGTGTTCQNAHSDGPASLALGQTYYDCAPLGTPGTASTYSVTMAMEASGVSPWSDAPGTTVCSDVVGGSTCIAGTSSNCVIAGRTADPTGPECGIWCYDGVLAGRVFTSTTGCFCPCPTGSTWN